MKSDAQVIEPLPFQAALELSDLAASSALRYLQEAHEAAEAGDAARMAFKLGRAKIFATQDEITALAEEHRLSFVVQNPPDPLARRTRHGFVI